MHPLMRNAVDGDSDEMALRLLGGRSGRPTATAAGRKKKQVRIAPSGPGEGARSQQRSGGSAASPVAVDMAALHTAAALGEFTGAMESKAETSVAGSGAATATPLNPFGAVTVAEQAPSSGTAGPAAASDKRGGRRDGSWCASFLTSCCSRGPGVRPAAFEASSSDNLCCVVACLWQTLCVCLCALLLDTVCALVWVCVRCRDTVWHSVLLHCA